MSTLSLSLNPAPVSAPRLAVVGTVFSLAWSSAFIAGKIGLGVSGPLTLLSLRFLLAAALLAACWPWLGRRAGGTPAWDGRAVRLAIAAGLLTNGVYLGLAYTGMRSVPAGLTAILVSVSPLLTAALAALWLREPFGWRGALGLAAGFGGVSWVMGSRALAAPADPYGMALILVSTVALAAATLLNRRVVGRMDPWRISLLQLLASGLALLPLAWWREGLAFQPGVAFFGSLLYQASVVSIGTTLMLLWLVRHGGAARASSFHLLNPVFGTLLAVGLLGESIPWSDYLGILPILAGLALVLRRGR